MWDSRDLYSEISLYYALTPAHLRYTHTDSAPHFLQSRNSRGWVSSVYTYLFSWIRKAPLLYGRTGWARVLLESDCECEREVWRSISLAWHCDIYLHTNKSNALLRVISLTELIASHTTLYRALCRITALSYAGTSSHCSPMCPSISI